MLSRRMQRKACHSGRLSEKIRRVVNSGGDYVWNLCPYKTNGGCASHCLYGGCSNHYMHPILVEQLIEGVGTVPEPLLVKWAKDLSGYKQLEFSHSLCCEPI